MPPEQNENRPARTIHLSVIVPMYNETRSLENLIAVCSTVFDPLVTELILVDDGSIDGTLELARSLTCAMPWISVLHHGSNKGKGAAVRTGVMAAQGEILLYMDADLSTSLACLPAALSLLRDADAVVGSRSMAGSRVRGSSLLRVIMGRTFNRLVRILAGVRTSDTQCGFKLFRSDVAKTVFGLGTVDRFAFDVEIIRIMGLLGFRMAEIPVNWVAGDTSSVRPLRDSWKSLVDVMAIRRQLRRRSWSSGVHRLDDGSQGALPIEQARDAISARANG